MKINRFNVRVYMFILNDEQLLLSDEIIQGKLYTKLPGGGLEYGEGPIDCIRREAFEEMNQNIEVLDHIYTTENFQASAFKITDQVLAIYYKADLESPEALTTVNFRGESIGSSEQDQVFRWVSLQDLSSDDLDFPTDKLAFENFIDKL